MLWFILCIAVLNMAAGFGLAVYLAGYTAGSEALSNENENADSYEDSPSGELDLGGPAEPACPVAAEAPSPATIAEEPATDRKDEPESSDNSVMADLDAAVSLALGDVTTSQSQNDVPPPAEKELPENHEDDPLQNYHSQLESFCEQLVALDDQLRKTPPKEAADLKSQVASVAESSHQQDEACQEVQQSLRNLITADTIDRKHGEAMIAAIQEERQEAAETAEAFEQIDLEGDAAAQCDTILNRTGSLLDANHSLRDTVSDMISTTQPPDGKSAANAEIDPLTGTMSRVALDLTLEDHWRKDPHRVRPLSLTVIDLDHFAKLNRERGPTLGDRVLRAVGQLLESEAPTDYHVARFAGQRFALLSLDRDLKQSVSDTERIRQTIETVQLQHGEHGFEITVSCGIVAAVPDDTQQTLYARAIKSVQEAKRYGRNRSFVHEGEYPTPVVPPNFALNEKHVTL